MEIEKERKEESQKLLEKGNEKRTERKRNGKKRIIVGATGASGQPLLLQCLRLIREAPEFESWLVMSEGARRTSAPGRPADPFRPQEC